MIIKSANFVKSSQYHDQCPEGNLPEYAFIGRSNVGKSSLINMLVNKKNLAKTSSKPGKTRLINHFIINDEWYLVDLPGYGFAAVSKTQREEWAKQIEQYLINRTNLMLLFVLIDVRLEPQKIDIDFINKLGEEGIPFSLVFTKSDKVSGNTAAKNVEAFRQQMLKTWESLPAFFVTSAQNKTGKEDILNYINEINCNSNQ